MNNNYRVYGVTVESGGTPAGGKIEVSHGCNGVLHADQPVAVRRDENDEVLGASLYVVEERGPCDGTCAVHASDDLGGFLYPFPVPAVETESAIA